MKRQEIADKLLAAVTNYANSKELKIPDAGTEKSYIENAAHTSYHLQNPMQTIGKFTKTLRAIHLPAQHYFNLLEEILNQHITNSNAIKMYELTQNTREITSNILSYVSQTAADLVKPAENAHRSDFEAIVGDILQECKDELKQYYLKEATNGFSEKLYKIADHILEIAYKIDLSNLGKPFEQTFAEFTTQDNYEFKNEYTHTAAETVRFIHEYAKELSATHLDKCEIVFRLMAKAHDAKNLNTQAALKEKIMSIFSKAAREKEKEVEAQKNLEKIAEKVALKRQVAELERKINQGNTNHQLEKEQLEGKLSLTRKSLDQQKEELSEVQKKTAELELETQRLKSRLTEKEQPKPEATVGFKINEPKTESERDKNSLAALNQVNSRKNKRRKKKNQKNDAPDVQHVNKL